MKSKYILLLDVLVLAMILTGCCTEYSYATTVAKDKSPANNISPSSLKETASSVANATYKVRLYNNSTFGITVKYPLNWEGKWTRVNGFDAIVLFSPQENQSDNFKDYIMIQYVNLTESPNLTNTTLEEVTSDTLNDIKKMKDAKILSVNDTILAKIPAKEVVYTATKKSVHLKQLAFYLEKEDKVYAITYVATVDTYPKLLGLAKAIINGIEFP
jgi:serine/threonine-protein kinase